MIMPSNKKRVFIFLLFAFGISWATALMIYLIGGLENSPIFTLAGIDMNLALVLLSTGYMFGPALANVFTRLITKEGKENLFLRPNFIKGQWRFFLIAWVLPGVLVLIGTTLYFLIKPAYFDPNLSTLTEMIDQTGGGFEINPWVIVVAQTIQAIIIAPLLNAIPTFGEEFGWRAYLQPKLMPLGGRKSILLTGIIWGVWHWPVILMGYNYGKDYFGAPILGPLAMVWFTLTLSAIFGWVTIKSANVWPAVIAHGGINGIAAFGLIFIQGNPDLLLGPTPVGLIGGLGLTITALIIFCHPIALKPREEVTSDGIIHSD